MGDLFKLDDKDVTDLIRDTVGPKIPTKLSQVTNDSNFVTSSGSVASVTSATNTNL